jgi:hypothetical protein
MLQALQGIFFLAGNDSGEDKAKKLWAPVLQKLEKFPGMRSAIQEHVELPNYKIFFDAAFGPLESHGAMGAPASTVTPGTPKTLFTQGFMKRAQEHPHESTVVKRHGPGGDNDDGPMMGSAGPVGSLLKLARSLLIIVETFRIDSLGFKATSP